MDSCAVNNYFHANIIDVVILAAGKVGGILDNATNPVDFLNTNLRIHLNLTAAAQFSECHKVVLLGSSCMYPKDCKQPMSVSELSNGKMEPTSVAYATSKIAALQLGFSYNQQFGTNKFLCIIPNSAYGPGDNFDPDRGHVLSALIDRFHHAKHNNSSSLTLWGSGIPRREFIFSEDIANAIIFLLESGASTRDQPINIGSGVDHSIRELAEIIKAEVGFVGTVDWDARKPDGAARKMLDSSPLNALGWMPKTNLEAGIKATYAWYLNNAV